MDEAHQQLCEVREYLVTTRMYIARDCAICSSPRGHVYVLLVPSQWLHNVQCDNVESQETWQLVSSDELVVLWELLLVMHTLCIEKKLLLLLSLLSIKKLLGSKEEEGSCDLQIMPELLNKVFSTKAT